METAIWEWRFEYLTAKERKGALVTMSLIAVNILVFFTLPLVFKEQYPSHPVAFGASWGPLTLKGQWWRLLSSSFIHVEILHLTANMVVLYFAGKELERFVRGSLLLLIYLGCGIAADLTILAVDPHSGSYGASGGVMGIVGALSIIYLVGTKKIWHDHKKKVVFFGLLTLYILSMSCWGYSYSIHAAAFATGMILALILGRFGGTARREIAIGIIFSLALVLTAALLSRRFQGIRPRFSTAQPWPVPTMFTNSL